MLDPTLLVVEAPLLQPARRRSSTLSAQIGAAKHFSSQSSRESETAAEIYCDEDQISPPAEARLEQPVKENWIGTATTDGGGGRVQKTPLDSPVLQALAPQATSPSVPPTTYGQTQLASSP
jgi:hypothetical protein